MTNNQVEIFNDQIICLKNTLFAVKTKLEHVLQIGNDYNLECLDALNDFTNFLKLYAQSSEITNLYSHEKIVKYLQKRIAGIEKDIKALKINIKIIYKKI